MYLDEEGRNFVHVCVTSSTLYVCVCVSLSLSTSVSNVTNLELGWLPYLAKSPIELLAALFNHTPEVDIDGKLDLSRIDHHKYYLVNVVVTTKKWVIGM